MNKKILSTVLALSVVLLAVPNVYVACATPSTHVSGTQLLNLFTGVTVLDQLPAGKSDNLKLTTSITDTWIGDIAGTTTYESTWIVHDFDPGPPPGGTPNIHETIFFSTVSVLGKSGSLKLVVNLGGSKGVFSWTILSGTGELANLHGNGIYYSTDIVDQNFNQVYVYEGQVHFDP
jgi:hypothetical protein